MVNVGVNEHVFGIKIDSRFNALVTPGTYNRFPDKVLSGT
jgi:hypothetical protein